MEKSDTRENKICDICLAVQGNDLFVSRQGETFEAASKSALNALQEQIKRMKGKLLPSR